MVNGAVQIVIVNIQVHVGLRVVLDFLCYCLRLIALHIAQACYAAPKI